MSLPTEFADQPELDALAEELRAACVVTELKPGFEGELQQLLTPAWTWKKALGRDPWMRLAAGLLVMSTVAAPVAAVMEWVFRSPKTSVVLGFEPWTPPLEVDTEDGWDPGTVPPFISMEDGPFGLSWQNAVELSNRMAKAVAQWKQTHPLGGAFSSAPAFLVWDKVGAKALEHELIRRCALGILDPPPAGLVSRVQKLANDGGHAEALKGWLWVLNGTGNSADLFAND